MKVAPDPSPSLRASIGAAVHFDEAPVAAMPRDVHDVVEIFACACALRSIASTACFAFTPSRWPLAGIRDRVA